MTGTQQPRPMRVIPFQSKRDQKWRVRIVGANGEKVMVSEAYTRRANAVRAAGRLVDAGREGFEMVWPIDVTIIKGRKPAPPGRKAAAA